MEERIIDDEYGRGIRLKKTKDGYVDVTDELAPETEGELPEEEGGEELTFAFPEMDEDDEDLVGLSPEEAAALRLKKLEAAAKRKEEYEQALAEGANLLEEGNFSEAEKTFEKALNLDEQATQASVGYWRAKTENFAKPDELVKEYLEEGIHSLEYDLGYEAVDIVKKEYRAAFEKRLGELTAEETPLADAFESRQTRRREVLRTRLVKASVAFGVALLVFLACVAATVGFALKIPTVPDSTGYIVATAVCGGASLLGFIVSVFFFNKFKNALGIYLVNERLSSTEEGARLEEIRAYKAVYEALLADVDETETEEN